MENSAVIYTRYSSSGQDEQTIEVQTKKCMQFAEENGLVVVDKYIDEAKSGRTTDKRTAFQKMLRDSDTGKFQYLIVYKFDRFARNVYDSLATERLLKKKGVMILSSCEMNGEDAQATLARNMNAVIAQFYSDDYSQRIRAGLENNASKFLTIGNNVPLGFKTNKETKQYEIDEATAPIVKKIFEMYSKDKLVAEIIRYLNDKGYQTSLGREFNKNSINRILRNKKYIGTYVFKGTETPNAIPRIISDKLFYEVNDLLDKNQKAPARARAFTKYLLTTKLFCGYCEEMMTGYSAKKKYNYYGCKGTKQHKCEKRPISKDLIEDLVVKETKYFLDNDMNIDMIIKEVKIIAEQEKGQESLKSLQKQMSVQKKRKGNILQAIADCEDEELRSDLLSKLNEIKEVINLLEIDIIKTEIPFNDLLPEKIMFFLKQLQKADINDIKAKELLINTFVNKILLYEDRVVIFFQTQKKEVNIEKDLIEKANSLFLDSSSPPNF